MNDPLPHEKGFHVSWVQIHRDSRALAWRLDRHGPGADGAWRSIVAITRGGMVPACIVARELNMPFEQLCEVTGDRLGQDARYWLDSSAIKNDVGWESRIGWHEGLAEMVVWGRKYIDQLRDWPMDYVLRA